MSKHKKQDQLSIMKVHWSSFQVPVIIKVPENMKRLTAHHVYLCFLVR